MIPTGDLDLGLLALIGSLLVLVGLAMLFLVRRRGKIRDSDEE